MTIFRRGIIRLGRHGQCLEPESISSQSARSRCKRWDKKKIQISHKSDGLAWACREGLTTSVILDNGTLNHEKYIEYVLPVALKYGNEMMGSD